jgi:hypothetical protein
VPKSRSRRTNSRRPAQRRPAQQRRQHQEPVPPPTAPGLRGAVERRSAPLLVWFSHQPKVLLPAGSLALLVGGFVAPLWLAAPLLMLLLLLVAWLTYLSWPAVARRGRVVRVATVLLLLLALVSRVAGDGAS